MNDSTVQPAYGSLQGFQFARSLRGFAPIALLAVVYVAAGRFGLSLAVTNKSVTLVWPPTGLALAALLLFGYRLWPGILLGAFVLNFLVSGSPLVSGSIAIGNTLEALAGAWLVRRFAGGIGAFKSADRVFLFTILAGGIATALSATIGVCSLALGGLAQWETLVSLWPTWWLGDAVSAVVITPLLVIWKEKGPGRLTMRGGVEAAALVAASVAAGQIVFSGWLFSPGKNYPLPFLIVPFLMWAAFRFGQRGAVTLAFIECCIAILGTVRGHGPFALRPADESLLLLQIYLGTMSLSALVLAAVLEERQQAMERIKASESQFRQVTESIREVFWMTSVDKKEMVYVSPGYEEIWGRSCAGLYASPRDWLMAIHPQDRERLLHAALNKQADGRYDEEYRIIRPDGSIRWIRDRAFPVRDETGKITRITGVADDITARKQAEAQSRELAAIVEGSEDAIVSKSLEGKIISWNRAAERIYGYTAEEAIGRHISIIVPPDRMEETSTNLDHALRGEKLHSYETVRRHKDGTLRHVSLTMSGVRDSTGKVTGVSVIGRDITEQKLLEKEILEISARERRRLGHELHDGLGQHLAGVAFKAKFLEESLKAEFSQYAQQAHEIVAFINEGISQTRRVARGLDPIEVEASGLLAALQTLASQTEKTFRVPCRVTAPDAIRPVNASTSAALFRISQEAIRNSIVHGEAGELKIDLRIDNKNLILRLRDNGKGLNGKRDRNNGMGLRIMQYRANSVGGSLRILSQPDEGVEVVCQVPYPASVPQKQGAA